VPSFPTEWAQLRVLADDLASSPTVCSRSLIGAFGPARHTSAAADSPTCSDGCAGVHSQPGHCRCLRPGTLSFSRSRSPRAPRGTGTLRARPPRARGACAKPAHAAEHGAQPNHCRGSGLAGWVGARIAGRGAPVVRGVEPGALVARGERLHDSLDALPGRGAAGERVHGDSLLELEGRAVGATVDVLGHGLLRRLTALCARVRRAMSAKRFRGGRGDPRGLRVPTAIARRRRARARRR
jgi:hypothetical protein